MNGLPRIRLRRFAQDMWEQILTHTALFEVELHAPHARGTIVGILRRYQKEHTDVFFHMTVVESCLVKVERLTVKPSNPLTGKPCCVRVDVASQLDEEGVLNALVTATDTFIEALDRQCFREFLAQRFTVHVLKQRREWRRLGLDHDEMEVIAQGMFQKCCVDIEQQAARHLAEKVKS